MSYEPTLIISYKDIQEKAEILEQEQWGKGEEKIKVAKYLTEIANSKPVNICNVKIVICCPELTSFNALVRDRLDELEIEYGIDF